MKGKSEHKPRRLDFEIPIWKRNPGNVSQVEYQKFYMSLTKDWQIPRSMWCFGIFRALIFGPTRAPFEEFDSEKIKLFVRGVFVLNTSNELVPDYLTFIKGDVDSDDLPLDTSRDILQRNEKIQVIRESFSESALRMLKELAKEKIRYNNSTLSSTRT